MEDKNKTEQMIADTAWDMIYLLNCALCQMQPDNDRVARMDQRALYALARFHSLNALVGTALRSVDTGEMRKRWESAIDKGIRKTVLFDAERAALFSFMEKERIWYMPLKGIILKDFYPVYGSRQMADNDILFDATQAGKVRDWFVNNGYEVKAFAAGVHDSYLKNPIFNFEMHRTLFAEAKETWYAYFEHVKDRLVKDAGNDYGYHFSDEDFYIYFFTHAAKHFTGGGSGLRSLTDLYLYTSKKQGMDWRYIESELTKLGLADDERRLRELAYDLFAHGVAISDETLSSEQYALLAMIVSAGTYGTLARRVQNKIREEGRGKLYYMLDRFFVPVSRKNKNYKSYAGMYPIFYKYKILLPVLPFYRTIRAMKAGRFKAEAKALRDV